MASIGSLLSGAIGGFSQAQGAVGSSEGWNTSVNDGWTDSAGSSWGSSASEAWNSMDSEGWSNSVNDSWSESQSGGSSASDAWNSSYGRTYGREASAQDIANAEAANKANVDMWNMQAKYNAEEAKKERDWSQYMQDTYYQRLVKDLKSAGLNPILALSGYGSSAPTGATASTGLASAAKANAFAESYSRSEGGSHSESSNWGWSKGGSHGESNSYNYSHERGGSRGSSSQGSSNYSHSKNSGMSAGQQKSQTSNNLRDLAITGAGVVESAVKAIGDMYNKGKERKERSSTGYHLY